MKTLETIEKDSSHAVSQITNYIVQKLEAKIEEAMVHSGDHILQKLCSGNHGKGFSLARNYS